MIHSLKVLGLFLLSLLLGLSVTHAGELTLAVVPQFPPLETYKRWSPVVELLSQKTGIKIELKTYGSIPEFERAFLRGEPDLVFMNPYHQVMAKRDYRPILRDSTPLEGILVVRRDSHFQSVKDLDGKTIAFPAPNAYAAALYMRALLTERHGIRFTPNYVKTHSNVYRHVALGEASAGGGVNNTFERETVEIKQQLRILYTTPPSAPHPLSAHKRVPVSVTDTIKKTMPQLAAENPELFDAIQMPKPTTAQYNRDYQPLERLRLETYIVKDEK